MARRKFGSVEKLTSGRYRARYRDPRSPETWIKAARTYESQDDAAAWLRGEEKLIEFGTWTHPEDRAKKAEKSAITVLELVDLWLADSDYRESTKQSHRRKLDTRVLNTALADEKVVDIDRHRIEDWWKEINRRYPTTRSTNATAYRRLGTAFKYAVRKEIIDVSPVSIAGAAKTPEPEVMDRKVIEPGEAKALVEHASDRLKAPVSLLLWAGLRLGELLELRRGDIDLTTGTISVARNAQRVTDPTTKKQVMISLPPKTKSGKRTLALPKHSADLLRTHVDEFMDEDEDALVVTTAKGQQMLDTNFRNRWNRLADLAGRPDITPHDARRFYGTMLVSRSGVPLDEARRLMGHETIEQLMEYMRADDDYQRRAATALEGLV